MTIIKLRRGTAAAWTAANTILSAGEPGFETDTGKTKTGDGVTTWTALAYSGGGGGVGESPVSSVAGKIGAVTLVKADVGLANADNTSDANKPVSAPQAAAIALKSTSLITVETVAGLTYTYVDADNDKFKVFTNAAGCAVTVPAGLVPGWQSSWRQAAGAGQIVFGGPGVPYSVGGSLTSSGANASGGIIQQPDGYLLVGAIGTLNEDVEDIVGSMIAAAGGTYNDETGAITLPAGGGGAAPFTVTGATSIGSTLTAAPSAGWIIAPGNWTADGVNISGATGLTYVTVAGDATKVVTYKPTNIAYAPAGITVAAAAGTALMATMSDNFAGASMDGAKWTAGYWRAANNAAVTLSQTTPTAGELCIQPMADTAGVNMNGYLSANLYNLEGSSAYLNVVSALSSAGNQKQATFAAYSDANNAAFFQFGSGSTFTCRTLDAGVDAAVGSAITFSGTTHRWMRIREQAGTIYWDAAPSTAANPPIEADFVNLRSATKPVGMTLAACRAAICGGTIASQATPTVQKFGSYNGAT